MWDVATSSGMPLNLELALTPAFQMFFVGPMQLEWTVPSGVLQAPLPLPSTPTLSGQTLFAQWLVVEPSQHGPVALSNALRIPLL